MITRFRIQNYKALRDVTLDLTPMHLLIGPNDSGKSSILEAIAALSRSVELPVTDSFTGAWSGDNLVYNKSDAGKVSFALTTGTSDPQDTIDYQLEVEFYSEPSLKSVKETHETLQSNAVSPSQYDNISNTTRLYQVFVKGIPHQDSQIKSVERILVKAIRPVHFYRWIPEHLAIPASPDVGRRNRMASTGFGLATLLDDIVGYDRLQFDQLEKRFCGLFKQFCSIKLKTKAAFKQTYGDSGSMLAFERADGKGLEFEFADGSGLIPASQVSDGILLVLAYLAILHLPEPPRLLLIEEPENGIHPARLKEVLTILRDLVAEQDHTQVILTSHSPYVVSMFEPEEVTLCHKGDDGAVEVRRLSDSKSVQEQMDFFTLGEIWTLEGDEALLEAAQESPAAP